MRSKRLRPPPACRRAVIGLGALLALAGLPAGAGAPPALEAPQTTAGPVEANFPEPDARGPDAREPDARELVRRAMDHWRGLSSHSRMTMTIHRPDWERSMTMESWSRGDELSLVRVIEPRRDAGNATLLRDDAMWTYSPKINRVIKVPSSMMSQSWMGSDFSNKDIAKSTDILDQYEHELSGTAEVDGHLHYTVTAVPHEDAAVVWGKEVLTIRDDWVLMREEYWDQDGVLVKVLETLDVAPMGGRNVARVMRMGEVDKPGEWTQLTAEQIAFDVDLPDETFTLSNLRNPRQ